jgi:hypothetical protein
MQGSGRIRFPEIDTGTEPIVFVLTNSEKSILQEAFRDGPVATQGPFRVHISYANQPPDFGHNAGPRPRALGHRGNSSSASSSRVDTTSLVSASRTFDSDSASDDTGKVGEREESTKLPQLSVSR